jgi:hypothetical protein
MPGGCRFLEFFPAGIWPSGSKDFMSLDPRLRACESVRSSRRIFKIMKDWRAFVSEDGEDRIKVFDTACPRCVLQDLVRQLRLL